MVEAVVALVLGPVVVAAPASINKLARRKAKRFRKNQRESLYLYLGGGRYWFTQPDTFAPMIPQEAAARAATVCVLSNSAYSRVRLGARQGRSREFSELRRSDSLSPPTTTLKYS
jgi:hypothetical protein